MRYLPALLFPPLAVLLCAKPFQAVFNFLLWAGTVAAAALTAGVGVVFYPVPVIHALLVVQSRLADNRQRQLIRAVSRR